MTPLRCLSASETCFGAVEYREPLSGSGQPFPRCERHWQLRLAEHERINDRYPDSPVAPANFDPAFAGERWDED